MERALSTGGAAGTTRWARRSRRCARSAGSRRCRSCSSATTTRCCSGAWAASPTRRATPGVDGVLVVDLPPEESGELDGELARGRRLSRVPLLAPTTSPERARAIVARASGFAYYVALTGVTGAGHLDVADVGRRAAALRPALGALPLAVGFGVRDPASARALAPHCDAVVVGSALVQAIADAPDAAPRRRPAAYARVRALKARDHFLARAPSLPYSRASSARSSGSSTPPSARATSSGSAAGAGSTLGRRRRRRRRLPAGDLVERPDVEAQLGHCPRRPGSCAAARAGSPSSRAGAASTPTSRSARRGSIRAAARRARARRCAAPPPVVKARMARNERAFSSSLSQRKVPSMSCGRRPRLRRGARALLPRALHVDHSSAPAAPADRASGRA